MKGKSNRQTTTCCQLLLLLLLLLMYERLPSNPLITHDACYTHVRMNETHQNSSGGGLPGDEFACPVLRLGHECALELLFALPCRLLLLLFWVIWREFGLLSAAEEGKGSPQ